MIKVPATTFRNHLFDYLKKAEGGETIVIRWNGREVARLIPAEQTDWRKRMTTRPELLVPAEALIEPTEGVWEDYV